MRLKLVEFQFTNSKLLLSLNSTEVFIFSLELVYTEKVELIFQVNAFNKSAFFNLSQLTIVNVKTNTISKGAFTGLRSLRYLSFLNTSVEAWEDDVLDSCNETLTELILWNTNDDSSIPRDIKPLTGSTTMHSLTVIQIIDNLKDSIDHTTFIGLENVLVLNLSKCQIEIIGPQSFYSITKTLLTLDLRENKLIKLPDSLFPSIEDNSIAIYLGYNPWHCDCRFIKLELELREKLIIQDKLKCASPSCLENIYVDETQQCTEFVIESCNAQPPPNPPGVFPGDEGIGSPAAMMTKECFDEITNECEDILIKGQTKIKDVIIDEHGVVTIEIDVETYSKNWVVIWFHTKMSSDGVQEYYESSDEIVCQSSETAIFTIRNLTINTAYTICLVDKGETTISPLDCMPYYFEVLDENNDDAPWILEEDKVKVISFVACGGIVSIILGIVLSFVLIRNNPTWLRGNKRIVRVGSSVNSDVMIMPPEWRKESTSSAARGYFVLMTDFMI